MAAMLMLVLVPSGGLAQVDTPSIPVPADESTKSWAKLSYSHLFETDVDDSSLEVSRNTAMFIAGHRFGDPGNKLRFSLQGAYQLTDYDFSNDTGLLWEDIHQFTLIGLMTYVLDAKWTLLGGGVFRLAGESGADFGDALTGGGFAGFLYSATEDLKLGVLLGAVSQLEDGAAVLPLPLVRWKLSDDWRFNLGAQHLGSVGYGPELLYAPSAAWDLGVNASIQRRRYRLEDSGLTEGFIGDETSVPIVFKAAWHPEPHIDLGVFAGVVTGGSLRMETSTGNKVLDENYDASATLGLHGTIRF